MRRRARTRAGRGSLCPRRRSGIARPMARLREGSGLSPGGRKRPIAGLATSISTAGTPRRSGHFSKARALSASPTCMGNGWEWTATLFAPFPGFQRFRVLSRLFGQFLRWRALRDEGRQRAYRGLHAAPLVSKLVSAALPVRLRGIPLREELDEATRDISC